MDQNSIKCKRPFLGIKWNQAVILNGKKDDTLNRRVAARFRNQLGNSETPGK